MSSNVVKCKYCEFKTARFKGKGNNVGGRKLFKHVIDCHEEEFLAHVGFEGTIVDYLDMTEEEEDALQSSSS